MFSDLTVILLFLGALAIVATVFYLEGRWKDDNDDDE